MPGINHLRTDSRETPPVVQQVGVHGYTEAYYEMLEPGSVGSLSSARVVVPILVDLLRPESVIDLGCGIGGWLHCFEENGVKDYVGVDLDAVSRDRLMIPKDRFRAADLREPFRVERSFDLAICLEVAGNLPPADAGTLVESLVQLSPAVAFSAPIPGQGGPNQLNLQWPEYWVELFAKHGFVVLDPIRPKVWSNPEVKWWFSQNCLLYVREDVLSRSPTLQSVAAGTRHAQLDLVHPELLQQHQRMVSASLKKTLNMLPELIWRAVRRRILRRE